MWNEEGGDGEHRVVPSEPDLVGSIPGQGVQVVHEHRQGCISCGTCSYPELTKDHVLTSAYVKIFKTVTRNAINKSV